jgi:hypothetical protein
LLLIAAVPLLPAAAHMVLYTVVKLDADLAIYMVANIETELDALLEAGGTVLQYSSSNWLSNIHFILNS